MNHLGTKILETERLVLRLFKESDVEDMYHNWASNNNFTRYLTWLPLTSKDIAKSVVDLWVSKNEDLRN